MAESSIVEFEERLIIHAPANVVERMLVDAPALPQWRTCMRENVEILVCHVEILRSAR